AERSRETYHSACGTGWSTPLVSARNHGPPSAPGTSSSWVAWAVSASSLAAYAESSSSTLWVSRESGTAGSSSSAGWRRCDGGAGCRADRVDRAVTVHATLRGRWSVRSSASWVTSWARMWSGWPYPPCGSYVTTRSGRHRSMTDTISPSAASPEFTNARRWSADG